VARNLLLGFIIKIQILWSFAPHQDSLREISQSLSEMARLDEETGQEAGSHSSIDSKV
jgi:hypothetical protein